MTTDTAPKPPEAQRIIAPKRGRATSDSKPRTRKKSLAKPLEEFFTSLGTMVSVVNQADGIAIVQGSERLAKALNEVAKDNPTVYRNLERMLTGSAWGSVFVAASAIALPILANHNLLPFQIPGMTIEPANTESMPHDIPDISGQNVSRP